MATHLVSGRVNLAFWREVARRELLDCLDKCIGSKAVVWDDFLTGPIGLIAEYSLLKEHEVDRMFPLRPGHLPLKSTSSGAGGNIQNVIFIVRPRLELMTIVADNIRKAEENPGRFRKEFHIYFVPRKSLLCERKLTELGVYGTLNTVGEYNLDLLPFDSDILSMESDSAFKDCYLQGDPTCMFHVAKSLMKLQALYGIIPNIYGKGECSRQVTDMIMRMRREMAGTERLISPQIDCLLLIDRNVDLLTPLMTQLTYEGLIDEIYGITNATVKLPPEKFAKKDDDPKQGQQQQQQQQDLPTEPKKVQLNSADELFSVIRDRNFHAVGPELSRRAKILSAQYEERKDAKSVSAIRQFVSKLHHIQAAKMSLATHTSIAELIKERTDKESFMDSLQTQQEFMNGIDTDKINSHIEDCIARKEPLIKVLRLLCMQSVTNNGLKPKIFDYYRKEILQTYGFENNLSLQQLERAGLLRVQEQKTYPTIRKTLKLVMEDVNEQNPTDISYVFSGYAPLSVRLAQFLARPGWRSIDEVLRLLPGPTIEEKQVLPTGLQKKRPMIGDSQGDSTKVTLIYFLGGVTYAEIAALRFLSQQEDAPTEFVIATTKIINGHNWLQSMLEVPQTSTETTPQR
ncbi:vacuolar protein sorting-associated protein 33A [Strongylocentrotus purpuratus]|uniref:Vacuolar protein sorting-associated protein 33A n=1 Tax=Strongylocentrotus purpuratus TaxID=7668 RepID=A0A7M7RIS7_STRPU|nr:vacuolar protein sorting-associated protein 33A [Strongylocentrotus purpuratus]XP_798265.2 vacuolar protein sorting-associated protein 33A [Strongylocentrotus purpuratus]|eukprot:XP_798265.2 PREDICTED: vacuolar protein sorting-associated protein 33A [Strongylocentrotus purpuratus]